MSSVPYECEKLLVYQAYDLHMLMAVGSVTVGSGLVHCYVQNTDLVQALRYALFKEMWQADRTSL